MLQLSVCVCVFFFPNLYDLIVRPYFFVININYISVCIFYMPGNFFFLI